jgi:hypothetical protein
MLRSPRASDPLLGPLTEDRRKARDSTKKVELSNPLEILALMLIPPEWLVLAASNLTGVQLFSELSFLPGNLLSKASLAELKTQRNMRARGRN